MKIYKYPLELTDTQDLLMPPGARILSVQMQHRKICLWAIVNDDHAPVNRRTFRVIGTGHEINDADNLDYIATVQENNFVWHIFEVRT